MSNPTVEAGQLREEMQGLVDLVGAIDFDLDSDVELAALLGRLVPAMRSALKEWLVSLPSEDSWWMDDTAELIKRLLGVRFNEAST